jgi:hypothetical protein
MKMASKWRAIAVGGVVVAALMQAEHESPGATGRGVAELRGAVTPAVSEAVGAAGDAAIIARDELDRQGINPGAVLGSTDGSSLPDSRDALGIEDAATPGPDVDLSGN